MYNVSSHWNSSNLSTFADREPNMKVNSKVVAVSFGQVKLANLTEPITITLQHYQKVSMYAYFSRTYITYVLVFIIHAL